MRGLRVCGHDCPPYDFRDLRDDGVSDAVNSVHPVGRPIIHSSKLAQRHFPISVPRRGLLDPPHSSKRPILWFRPPFTPDGVGNDEHPVPTVWGTNGARRYAIPFRVAPALGQVSENSSHSPSKQRCHVLHDPDGAWYHAKATHHLPVES